MRIAKFVGLGAAVLAIGVTAGCASSRPRRVASTEPPLLTDNADATSVVEAPQARPVTLADRHPLFGRPRDYYDNTNGNKLSKTAAATVIGVPSGIVAEMRQIVAGRPVSPTQ